MHKIFAFCLGTAVFLLNVSPGWADATPKAGTITLVIGKATVERGMPAHIQPVHFRDPVYVQDSIATEEESFVRVLLGRKALVTVSEMSVLTITEDLHQATINLDAGFIGLSVARKRMENGEFIEIRTPHAVAAVRGTKVIAEVPTPDITRVTVIEGHVDVHALSTPDQVVSVSNRQSIEISLTVPSHVETLDPHALEEKRQKLNPPKASASDPAASDTVVEKQIGQAAQIADSLTPNGTSGPQTGTLANANPTVGGQPSSGSSGASSSSNSSGGGSPSSGPTASAAPASSAPAPSAPAPSAPAPAPAAAAPAPAPAAPAPAPAAPAPAPAAPAPAPAAPPPAPVAPPPAPVAPPPAPIVTQGLSEHQQMLLNRYLRGRQ